MLLDLQMYLEDQGPISKHTILLAIRHIPSDNASTLVLKSHIKHNLQFNAQDQLPSLGAARGIICVRNTSRDFQGRKLINEGQDIVLLGLTALSRMALTCQYKITRTHNF